MCCNISKSHVILCEHVDHNYCYEVKKLWYIQLKGNVTLIHITTSSEWMHSITLRVKQVTLYIQFPHNTLSSVSSLSRHYSTQYLMQYSRVLKVWI